MRYHYSGNYRYLNIFLACLLLADLSYSFAQYFHQPLDGDMAWNILPSPDVAPIFDSPLGFDAIFGERLYANPNRYFGHWLYREYLLNMPHLMQRFVSPVDSVYLACALAKIVVHLLLVLLLTIFITGARMVFKQQILSVALLCTGFFQANGYRDFMGIIDPATTFTFFYALPSIYLLLLLLPAALLLVHGKHLVLSKFQFSGLIILVPIVCLSGPLNPAILLVLGLLYFIRAFWLLSVHGGSWTKTLNSLLPKSFSYLYFFTLMFAGYSLFVGKFNLTSYLNQHSILDSYARLPYGIYYQFSQKLGFPLIFLTIAVNYWLLKRFADDFTFKMVKRILFWIAVFSVLYIVLLPLGGYRPYRPNILRYDTILPITLGLIFLVGLTTTTVVKFLRPQFNVPYFSVLVTLMIIFTMADKPKFHLNQCERSALNKLSTSKSSIVLLPEACSVIDWRPIKEPSKSIENAELIFLWGITDSVRLYYQE